MNIFETMNIIRLNNPKEQDIDTRVEQLISTYSTHERRHNHYHKYLPTLFTKVKLFCFHVKNKWKHVGNKWFGYILSTSPCEVKKFHPICNTIANIT